MLHQETMAKKNPPKEVDEPTISKEEAWEVKAPTGTYYVQKERLWYDARLLAATVLRVSPDLLELRAVTEVPLKKTKAPYLIRRLPTGEPFLYG